MKRLLSKLWYNSIYHVFKRIELLKDIITYRLRYNKLLKNIQKKDTIHVIFFVINVGMWKCDVFFQKLLNSKRYKPIIVSYLFPSDSPEYKEYIQSTLREYFEGKGYPYVDSYNKETGEWLDVNSLHPDLIFYAQPYDDGYKRYRIKSFWKHCLFAYIPYCFIMEDVEELHNRLLHNIAWRLFYPTSLDLKMGKKYSFNRGENIKITGYPMADLLLREKILAWDKWKQKNNCIKKIIWAPHHSIMEKGTLHYSNFLELADEMLELAKEYNGRVQFAFKPHPRLMSRLLNHPLWGREKTIRYYEEWKNMPNTIFVEGDYIGLFQSSDALVHDCSSFMGEYLYLNKPLMFIVKDYVDNVMNDFGKACLEQHYKGKTIGDVRRFIDEVVLQGVDSMRETREKFLNEYLLPPNGQSVADIIYEEITQL